MILMPNLHINPTHINGNFGDYSGVNSSTNGAGTPVKLIEQLLQGLGGFTGGSEAQDSRDKVENENSGTLNEIYKLIGDFSSNMGDKIGDFLGRPQSTESLAQLEDTLYQMMFTISHISQSVVGLVYSPMLDVIADVMDNLFLTEEIEDEETGQEENNIFDINSLKKKNSFCIADLLEETEKVGKKFSFNKSIEPGGLGTVEEIEYITFAPPKEQSIKRRFLEGFASLTELHLAITA